MTDLVLYFGRNTNATGLGEVLEPRRDIDAIAMNVLTLDDHIAEVDANPEVQAPICGDICIAIGHSHLDCHRALDRIDRAAEFGQEAVAGGLEDAAAKLGDVGVYRVAAVRVEGGARRDFVRVHQGTVADDIGDQNRRKSALNACLSHGGYFPCNASMSEFYGWDHRKSIAADLRRGATTPSTPALHTPRLRRVGERR